MRSLYLNLCAGGDVGKLEEEMTKVIAFVVSLIGILLALTILKEVFIRGV